MTRADVVKSVKARLDEFSPFNEPTSLVALPTSDVKPMDSIIEEVLAKAQDSVLMAVPLSLVKATVVDATSEGNGIATSLGIGVMGRMTNDEEVGVMEIPSNFLRLHTVKFDTWRRTVNKTHPESGETYKVQRNPHTRARNEKPVICLNDGNFEVYSLTFPHNDGILHCTKFLYIPMTSETALTFEDTIAPLVILEAARMCLETFGDINGARALAEEEKTWLTNKG